MEATVGRLATDFCMGLAGSRAAGFHATLCSVATACCLACRPNALPTSKEAAGHTQVLMAVVSVGLESQNAVRVMCNGLQSLDMAQAWLSVASGSDSDTGIMLVLCQTLMLKRMRGYAEVCLVTQKLPFASGIDTGCVLGDRLTALVLPPITELEARGWKPQEPPHGVTRKALGAELVHVPARQSYCKA